MRSSLWFRGRDKDSALSLQGPYRKGTECTGLASHRSTVGRTFGEGIAGSANIRLGLNEKFLASEKPALGHFLPRATAPYSQTSRPRDGKTFGD